MKMMYHSHFVSSSARIKSEDVNVFVYATLLHHEIICSCSVSYCKTTSCLQAGDSHFQSEEVRTTGVPRQPPTWMPAYRKFTFIHSWSATSAASYYCILISFLPFCCSHSLEQTLCHTRSASTLCTFKSRLKTELFTSAYRT